MLLVNRAKLCCVCDRTFIKINVKVYGNVMLVTATLEKGKGESLRVPWFILLRRYYDLAARALRRLMEIEIFMVDLKDLLMKSKSFTAKVKRIYDSREGGNRCCRASFIFLRRHRELIIILIEEHSFAISQFAGNLKRIFSKPLNSFGSITTAISGNAYE